MSHVDTATKYGSCTASETFSNLHLDSSKQNTVTSVTLLGRIQDASDANAWGDFVECYAPRIFSWCRKYSLQESDAADVTQEVLIKLVTAMQTFRYDPSRGRFRGWLKTITVNVVRDMSRRRANSESPRDSQLLEILEDEQASNALSDSIEAAWQQEILKAAEDSVRLRVKPSTWNAYQLAAVEQLSAADTAERLGVPVADVYVSKSRVIKMLRIEVAKLETQEQERHAD